MDFCGRRPQGALCIAVFLEKKLFGGSTEWHLPFWGLAAVQTGGLECFLGNVARICALSDKKYANTCLDHMGTRVTSHGNAGHGNPGDINACPGVRASQNRLVRQKIQVRAHGPCGSGRAPSRRRTEFAKITWGGSMMACARVCVRVCACVKIQI